MRCAERLEPIGHRTEILDHSIQVLVVQAEGRHAHVQPGPDRDRSAEEGVEPVRLNTRALRREHRGAERRIRDQLDEVAAVALDNVTADAVAPMHERSSGHLIIVPRRPRRQRRRRLNLALEAHDRGQQAFDLDVAEIEVRHPQLLERLKHAALVEDPRIVQLGAEPRDLRGVRDVADEREIETRHQLGPLLREIRADRLRLFEALDVVAAEAPVPVDRALAELDLLLLGVPFRELRFGVLERHHVLQVVEQRVVDRFLVRARFCTVAGRPFQA